MKRFSHDPVQAFTFFNFIENVCCYQTFSPLLERCILHGAALTNLALRNSNPYIRHKNQFYYLGEQKDNQDNFKLC